MTVDVRSIDREQLQPFTVKEGAAQGRYTLDTAELNKLSSRYASVVSDVALPEVQGVPQMAQREGRTAETSRRREVGRGIQLSFESAAQVRSGLNLLFHSLFDDCDYYYPDVNNIPFLKFFSAFLRNTDLQ
ncbi:hypothetical protein AV274_6481 [Blastocystis sp. ATCC 50177/Nand II]|uniref:Uncharacterized protein n=1 Tax=Blastocystis sp. subtype 1 (strain ATCC 50177 / NandII) TaxID=478820 RepID=A0A196S3Z2_BLAHN|nr:hypothetical protein AV274_6481 [Blastocystis sp. ATCC 50177/Nand II]